MMPNSVFSWTTPEKLRLSFNKLQIKLKEVCFHGHVLTAEGRRAALKKVRAIQAMPTATNAKGVQRLIGFTTYLSKFMSRLPKVCELHRFLKKKDVPTNKNLLS